MVQRFKLYHGKTPSFPITVVDVETHIGRQAPWFVPGNKNKHFAICPYCDNPIQLKALYNRGPNSPEPYGSHVGKAVPGLAFNPQSQATCPYIAKQGPRSASTKRAVDVFAMELIDFAVSEFDRIVLVLRDDLGFRFSDAFAQRLLENWFSSEGYLYPGSHLRNLPWMILYLGGSANLYGQPVQTNGALADAIVGAIPSASFDERKRLVSNGAFFKVEMQALNHVVEVRDDELIEVIDVRVMDYTKANAPDRAEEVHRFYFTFAPDRFEGLIHTPLERAKRDKTLLNIAEDTKNRLIGRRLRLDPK